MTRFLRATAAPKCVLAHAASWNAIVLAHSRAACPTQTKPQTAAMAVEPPLERSRPFALCTRRADAARRPSHHSSRRLRCPRRPTRYATRCRTQSSSAAQTLTTDEAKQFLNVGSLRNDAVLRPHLMNAAHNLKALKVQGAGLSKDGRSAAGRAAASRMRRQRKFPKASSPRWC